MAEALPDHVLKVLLIGDAAVGKSSILLRFVDNTFSENIGSTIGVDFKAKFLNVRDRRVKLTIWDTAGQERFRTLTASYYRGCHAIILCYDCTVRSSFEQLENWLAEVEMYSTTNNPVKMLVANKIDKPNHEVSKEEGLQFARSKQMLFIQCSAKTKKGIFQAFEEVVHKVMDDPQLVQDTAPSMSVPLRQQGDDQTDEAGCC